MTSAQRNTALRLSFVCLLSCLMMQCAGSQVAVSLWAWRLAAADSALAWIAFFGACTIGSFVCFFGILWSEVLRSSRDRRLG